jgi:S-methylmethionine-dependent homocysteine/selenocysteine methylase
MRRTSGLDGLRQRLAAGGVVLLDGGMGTEIQARGVSMDQEAWSALANLTDGELVRQIHEDYIRAGAEVVIANTFPAGAGALAAAGLGERVSEINRAAVLLARQARDRAPEPPVAIAGSLSVMALGGNFSSGGFPGSPVEAFRVQADAIAEAGVDLLALEMMVSEAVAEPALQAASETGLPLWFGVSIADVTTDGVVVSADGAAIDPLLQLARDRVDALMVMHTDIEVAGRALPLLRRRWQGTIGAYPHVGDWTPPDWVFQEITPIDFAAKVAPWAEQGAQLLGGCCGIGPTHIQALHDALAGG